MKKTLLILLICLSVMVVLFATGTFAWLGLDQNTIVTNISGRLVTEYFHCGSGTANDPFVITRPIHYYHMVEFFQRLTNLPVVIHSTTNETVVKFGDEYLYFQIGCPEAQLYNPDLRPETDENTEYYVFQYDSFGILETETIDGFERGKKSTNLNMAYYSGDLAIMPIGSSEVPFVGQLDGKGLTVSNLNITTSSVVDVHTYDDEGNVTATQKNVERKTCDVGIFGFIGPSGVPNGETEPVQTAVKNVYFDNVTIDLSGLDPETATSVVSGQTHTSSATIHNNKTVCYAGYIAGHLTLSSLVQDVYVNNSIIRGGDAATVGYGYFGCVEDLNGAPVETLGSEIATLRAAGDDAGFGGSIDMKKMLERLQGIWNISSFPGNYVSSEVVIIDEVEHTVTTPSDRQVYSTINPSTVNGDTYRYHYYSTEKAGKYFYFNRTSMQNYVFMCLYGEGSRYPKTVTTYTYKDEFSDAWFIRDGNHYLSISGMALVSTNSQNFATKWMFDSTGHLYTVIEDTTEFRNYYLNRSGTTGLSIGTSASTATVWNYTESEQNSFSSNLYTAIGSTNYYIDYSDGWVITPYSTYYKIKAGSNHFLNANSSTVFDASAADQTVKWFLSNPDGNTTTISTYIDGTVYYLYNDGALKMSTSPTTWTKDGEAFYSTVQGVKYYLVYEDSWKVLPTGGKRITDGAGHYLTQTGSVIENGALADATLWQFSSESGDTQIYSVINGQKYFLTYNNGLALSASEVTWHREGNGFYLTSDGRDYYLTYDGSDWTAIALSFYRISDGSGNYLQVTGANGFANVSEENATHFYVTNEEGTNPSGRVYCFVNGNRYYLYNNGGVLQTTVVQNNGTQWLNDGNSLYIVSGTTTYALQYDSVWKIKSIIEGHIITDGTNYMTVSGTTIGNTQDPSEATVFTFNNTTGNPSGTIRVTGTNYYLHNNNGSLDISTTSTTWSNDGQMLYVGNNNSRRNLGYYAGSWHLTESNTTSVSSTFYTIGYNGHYLCVDSSGNLYDTTIAAEATKWSGRSGSIYAIGTDYYLYRNNDTLQTNIGSGTNWTNNNDTLYVTTSTSVLFFTVTTYHWITFNNGWSIDSENQGFGGAPTMTNLSINQVTETVNIRSFVESADTTHPRVAVSHVILPTPSIGVVNRALPEVSISIDGPFDERLLFEKTKYQTVSKEITTERGGYQTYFPIRTAVSGDADYDANDPYKVSQKNTGYIISAANIEDTSESNQQKLAGDIRISYFPISEISGSYTANDFTSSLIGYSLNGTTHYLTLVQSGNNYRVGDTTEKDDALIWTYDDNKLSTNIEGTTYYLTYNNGLNVTTSTSVNWTYDGTNNRFSTGNNNNRRYIRYDNGWTATNSTANSNLVLTKGNFTNIYTYDDSGNHVLRDAQKTEVYEQALKQLMETLSGSASVYGLHFMDSQISTDHLVTADYVSVFGQEYRDYEMPEDSIDFHVIERGSINFFAGEYFTNNNAFFSLHQVFRYKAEDAEVQNKTKKVNDIKEIKEIIEVYKHASEGDRTAYIYKFKDNTYSDSDGGYTGATSLASGYSSTPVFKTSWITAPSGLSTSSRRVYYFEIPCNAGEYCLGSVTGKTGAYLMYLDIATNGGDTIASAISSTGNDITNTFSVEFRDTPDTMPHSVLMFSIDAPEEALNKFSVQVDFDKTANSSPHQKGVYTITVVNNSDEDLTLYVYLCDDDYNITTPFQYAYQVKYSNSGRTDALVETPVGTVFQMMAGFTIPASGQAVEVTYH